MKVEAVRSADNLIVAQTVSDAQGAFTLSNLPEGRVKVRAAGPAGPVEFDDGGEIEVASDRALPELTIRLRQCPLARRPVPNQTACSLWMASALT